MKLHEEGLLLRVFIGEAAVFQGKPLYEQIVRKARELDLAGVTVLRGIMGFGASSRIKTAKILRLSEDLPLVVEIVDSQEYIDRLLPYLDEMVSEGLITIEKANVLRYGQRARTGSPKKLSSDEAQSAD